MLQVTDLRKAFGARDILHGLTFHVGPRDRIGLVATNGAGKTTLLRILAGESEADSGTIAINNAVQVGYLAQEGHVTHGNTVRQELMAGRPGLAPLLSELAEVEAELAALPTGDPRTDALVERHGTLQHRFEDLRGYEVETEVNLVLHALGFSQADGLRPVESFSGGWQMRVALGRLLIQKPDLLLLDEPTNHLDMAAVEWLEEYLRNYPGALLMVSHDRYILDRVTTRTLALDDGEIEDYASNYSGYVIEKARRLEAQRQAYERQQAFIEKTQAWIDRFGAKATKATQARSRERMLDRLEKVDAPEADDRQISLKFDSSGRTGRMVLEAESLTRQFGDHRVLGNVNLAIERGDRVALVGPNGAGKSTLLRLLAGVDKADHGVVQRGHNVQIAYFHQHQADTLDPTRTPLEEMAADSDRGQTELRSTLGRFLFTGDDAFKRIAVLSGGERSRLAFAKMMQQDANVLLLDEPTNHLDIPSQEVLEQALNDFPGTIVLASHDRYLIDRIATKVIAVGDGGIEVHLGNYTAYRERIAARAQVLTAEAPAALAKPKADNVRVQARRESAAARKRVTEIEAEIALLEAEVATLSEKLAAPDLYSDHVTAQQTIERHQQAEARLTELLEEWEEAAAAIV